MSAPTTLDGNAQARVQIALEVAAILAVAAVLYSLFGYWRFSWMGPSGFFMTADELYVYEWLAKANRGHFGSTLPYGQLFHLVLYVSTGVIRWFVPDALSLAHFTSLIRFVDALVWVAFACYCLAFGVRRLWLAVILLNPVVVFMAFGYAKPDFLCFALSVLAFLHWIRYARDDRSMDLFAAATFLGAALGAKVSAALTIPLYPLAFWIAHASRPRRQFPPLALLASAMLLVVVVTVVTSPQYLYVRKTIEVLQSEGVIKRFGFPGAPAYSWTYFPLILGLSFPIETLLSLYELRDRSRLRRTVLVGWLGCFVVFAALVRQEMPTHLLPLIAVLGAIGLDRVSFDRHYATSTSTIVMTAALCFSALSLYPKLWLNMDFANATSYGRAAVFLRQEGIRAKPLSELAIRDDDENIRTVAHFWRPDVLPMILNPLQTPQAGYYLLGRDTYIRATVNARRLGFLGPPYAASYRQFVDAYRDHTVFIEAHDLDPDRRFHEIHIGGYWPWRYILALIRREPVAPGSTIGVYRF
jgi:hypothetical protein